MDFSSGTLVLTHPPSTKCSSIEAFIKRHDPWIRKALASLPPPLDLTGGGMVLINGIETSIIHTPHAQNGCVLETPVLKVSGAAEHTERRVQRFLRELAARELPKLLEREAQNMRVTYTKLDVRNVRSRWGSCTRNGRIMLSWRLVMCPPLVQSYVAVHELAHLTYFDHSPAFWSHVDKFFSKGRSGRVAAELWLRQKGAVLLRVP
uniref:M48 family metallopeptidase n=1 Tax=Neokomagataea thailandica TaxID=661190 RepID=UPI001F0DECA2|nr:MULTISPECIES: SprT family zinc-dependent metalloprotease [Neokomagataea]